jgi:hypothetical protein
MNKTIYHSYTQKSKIFCYSVLGIQRGLKFVPNETYMSYADEYRMEDCRLICHFNKCNEQGFAQFAESKLKKSYLFESVINLSEKDKLFIFNFSAEKTNWIHLINGKYSLLTSNYKSKIMNFYKNNRESQELIKKLLYPNNHFEEFAAYLNVESSLMKSVGEIFDKPDFEKETFSL